jgi:hypothetical protein
MRTGIVGFVARLAVLAFLALCVAGCPPQAPTSNLISHLFGR